MYQPFEVLFGYTAMPFTTPNLFWRFYACMAYVYATGGQTPFEVAAVMQSSVARQELRVSGSLGPARATLLPTFERRWLTASFKYHRERVKGRPITKD